VAALAATYVWARRSTRHRALPTVRAWWLLCLTAGWWAALAAPFAWGDPTSMNRHGEALYGARFGLTLVALALLLDVLVWVIMRSALGTRPAPNVRA
jgi:hypothetical protein